MTLPHRFPFRLVDRKEDAVHVALSANAFWMRGGGVLDAPLVPEIAAQAAALLLVPAGAAAEEFAELRLAGVSECELARPLRAGERLELEVALEARLGAVIKVAVRVAAAGEQVARLGLTLSGPSR